MEIKRISKWSNIDIFTTEDFKQIRYIKILQVVADERYIGIEYISEAYIDKYIEEQSGTALKETVAPVKSEAQKELETALDTMLNNDPRQKYTGCNLRVPFDRGDWEWINWCLDNMHNEFIRKRIELIKNSGYGRE